MECVGEFFDDLDDLDASLGDAVDAHAVHARVPTADEAVAELEAAWDEVRAAGRAMPARRWWRERAYRRAAQRFNAANQQFQRAFDGIAEAAVGSIPGQWGLLSDSVESTLDAYVTGDISGELREHLKAIRDSVFEARIQAHAGDRSLETELTRQLAACLDLEPDNERARKLIHHLPACARPIPEVDVGAVPAELARGGSAPFDRRFFHYNDLLPDYSVPRFPVRTFTVSFAKSDTLELHDIVVNGMTGRGGWPPRPQGSGTAALEHLCRSADHYGLAIVGKIMPGDRTEESATRLAGWYGRYGFEVKQQRPGEHLWATIRRAPNLGPPQAK
ncbi:hypothetical protein MAUB_00430 [Mycolicibacterium aubagnense]|uniref:N-acetyltransferase domain-containing protein n=1 Tax=Mycolicibacterium aubagnense TaxID=319707 RepID=A0ABN5YMQ0_9MYCO|nr:hypothetical protein MAUB_00430 [Mycolicibacterium aubagnense]